MVRAMKKPSVKRLSAGVQEVSGKKLVKFVFKGDPKQEVYVAGTFNDWNPVQLKLKENDGGVYHATLNLSHGKHEYKFIVNGDWHADANCPECTPNGHGTINSVVAVA